MDIASIFGLLFAFGCILAGFLGEGGSPAGLISITAAPIILGGTTGAVCISFPINDLKLLPQMFGIVFINKKYKELEIIDGLTRFAEKARREGLLVLENDIEKTENLYIKKGLRLIVDGIEQGVIRETLERELYLQEMTYSKGSKIFSAAGGFSPTMGIIGTVLGLISVLSEGLDNPETLAPKIALAFIATLYGIGFANLIWLPFELKVKNKAAKESLIAEIIIEGIVSIQEGITPLILKDKLCYSWFEKANGTKSQR